MGRGIFGPAKMGRGIKKKKKNRMDLPPAGRKIHFFKFLNKNDQIWTQNDQK